jgi:type I restriction enzyme S subunit
MTVASGWSKKLVANSVQNIPLTGRKLPLRDYAEVGQYPVIDQGQKFIGGYTDQENLLVQCSPPVIVFGDHTKAIKYVNIPFVAGADGIKVLKPLDFFNPRLLYYFLQAIELPEKGYARHYQFLAKSEIPVPPLPEQERIVARIESLFTQLDAGVAALKRLQAALKRYRASVLKAACEGRLVPQDPSDEPAEELLKRILAEKGNKIPILYGEMPELPKGWALITLGELSCHITSGSRGWAKYYTEKGSLFIRVGNFNRLSKTIDLSKKIFVSPPKGPEAERTQLKINDLLITITADVGMVGVVEEATLMDGEAYINQHVCLVRLKFPYISNFIAYTIASEIIQKQINRKQYGATKLGLNLDDIKSITLPIPPLEEQNRVVAEIERRMSVIQKLEQAVSANLKRAARLRQAILKRAFEGKLVEQNPQDEPTGALLERLRSNPVKPTNPPTSNITAKQLPLIEMD